MIAQLDYFVSVRTLGETLLLLLRALLSWWGSLGRVLTRRHLTKTRVSLSQRAGSQLFEETRSEQQATRG